MAKNDGNDRKKRRARLRRRAMRDVRLSLQPLLDELERLREQTIADYAQVTAQVGNLYDALARELTGVGAGFTDEMARIARTFGGQVGGLGELIGGAAPEAERAAAEAFLGAIGGVGEGLLGVAAGRNAAYGASALRQGAIESMVTQRNLANELRQRLDELAQQRIDVKEMIPELFRQRLDELRQMMFERMLARKELGLRELAIAEQIKSNKALAKYLIQSASRDLRGGRSGRGRGKGKGKGKPKPNPPPNVAHQQI